MAKRLYKSENKMLCGVCAGIAEYFDIDPTLVRLITVFLLFAGVGSGLIAYIVAAVIIPERFQNKTKSAKDIPEKEAER
ncbi:PspC domain-containing protein [Treponema sp. OMZ 840]|uniref:PspC domain-containing protein n=1 Tax=Treponema sp. OMZ 840 TaxID=244313 RepID=UPI003D8EE16E